MNAEECNKIKEENEQLKDLLKKATDGPRLIGIVESKQSADGFYRVSSNGQTAVFPAKQDLLLNVGDTILIAANMIERILPVELKAEEKPVEFKPVLWNEIGGMKSQIENIRSAVEDPIRHASIYKEFGLDPIKGLMLYGPPGCGKTLIAKAIATSMMGSCAKVESASFVYIKGGEMLSPLVGMAEANIKKVFDSCREYSKRTGNRSILFIDEAEAIVPVRGSRQSSDVDTTIVPTFLAEMDGFGEHGPFVILATNHPGQIDPAIQREGRIDLKIEISRPNITDCVELFEIYLNKTKVLGSALDLSVIAASELFTIDGIDKKVSGAKIKNIVSSAIKSAINRKIKNPSINPGVCIEDIEFAISNN